MDAEEAVGAIVFDAQGRVLLVRRGKAPGTGDWTIPGGRVEPGEALAAAAERELREETGLEVEALRELEVVEVAREGYRYRIHEHLCRLRGDAHEPRAADDAADARWVALDGLAPLGVRAEAAAVIRRAAARAHLPW